MNGCSQDEAIGVYPPFQMELNYVVDWSENLMFKMAAVAAILDSDQNKFSYFLSTSHPNASYSF